MTRLICWLLWLANSDPPSIHRQRFYGMKHAILRRWATREPRNDIQCVVKTCYGCDGTGIYQDSGRDCRRCWGTGEYARRVYRLARWRWHGRIFHVPDGEADGHEINATGITIHGRIEHARGLGWKPDEAALWLALFFDRSLFSRLMTGGSPCGWTGLPLCTLNQLVFGVAMRWRVCMREFRHRHRLRQVADLGQADDIPF